MKHIIDDPEKRSLRAPVDNAGVEVNAPVEALPLSDWRRLLDVNFFGQLAMTQALLPALIDSQGTVVNISSLGGKVAMATYGPTLARSSPSKRSATRCAERSSRLE